MSWNPLLKPGYPDAVSADAIETLIVPRAVDLGGFEVRRALPAPQRQMGGPFIFLIRRGQGSSSPDRERMCAPILTSDSPRSRIYFAARSCIRTA